MLRRALAIVLCLVIAGCMLAPGTFVSALDVRRDGTFSFRYAGDIHVLALSRMIQQQMRPDATFAPAPCFGKDSGAERECTRDEVAGQKREWEAEQARGASRRQAESARMKAIFGDIDFSSPRAADELAARLRKQAGWRKVDNKGNGRFDVEFAIAGRLDHDFSFPTIERFPQLSPFVLVSLRSDGTVRLDAPAFAQARDGAPFGSMAAAMAGLAAADRAGQADAALPVIDGKFTLTTDGEVLANNTEEGARSGTTGRMLEWTITPRTTAAPMAVVRLR